MNSEEGSGGLEEQQSGGDAATLAGADSDAVQHGEGSSASQLDDKLGEAWPRIELDGDKGLVVCTIDVQRLTGAFFLRWSKLAGRVVFSRRYARLA